MKAPAINKDNPPAPSDNARFKKWFFYFLFFVAVLVFAIRHFSGIEKDFSLLEKVKPWWLAVSILLQLSTYVVTALIYFVLLKASKVNFVFTLFQLIKASIIALFFNQTVPSASISGNVFFFQFLSRLQMKSNQILLLIFTELFIFYTAFETLLLFLLVLCISLYTSAQVFISTLSVGIVVYFILGIAILFTGKKNLLPKIYKKITKIKFIRRLLERSTEKIKGMQMQEEEVGIILFIQTHKLTALKIFAWQLFILIADALTIYALFRGIGIHTSIFTVLICFVCTQIVSLLPFLPGSLIIYESSMSLFFAQLHIPLGSAIVATLLFRFLSFWLPLPFGLFFYRKWRRTTVAWLLM